MKWLLTHRAGPAKDYREDHCVLDSLEEALDEVRSVFGMDAARTIGRLVGESIPSYIFPAGGEVKIHISSKAQGGAGLVASDDSGAMMDSIILTPHTGEDRMWFGCLTKGQ